MPRGRRAQMRTMVFGLLVMLPTLAAVHAQTPSTPAPPAPPNEPPKLQLTIPIEPIVPERRQFGVFTLEPPQVSGQIVSVGVPIGALLVRGVSSVKKAQHRRAERKARAQVQRELEEYLNSVIKN